MARQTTSNRVRRGTLLEGKGFTLVVVRVLKHAYEVKKVIGMGGLESHSDVWSWDVKRLPCGAWITSVTS